MAQYVDLTEVLNFVDKTTRYGVPMRVALLRAERRFGVPRGLVRAAVRAGR